jgi:hypothetical protein
MIYSLSLWSCTGEDGNEDALPGDIEALTEQQLRAELKRVGDLPPFIASLCLQLGLITVAHAFPLGVASTI